MTTLAYKEGILVADGYLTSGSTITQTKKDKRIIVDGVHFFQTGPTADYHILIQGYFDGRVAKEDIDRTGQVGTIVYDKKKGFFGVANFDEDDGVLWTCERIVPFAMGSGAVYALGAMDAGASAKEAVKIASDRDIYTGGKIRTYRIV